MNVYGGSGETRCQDVVHNSLMSHECKNISHITMERKLIRVNKEHIPSGIVYSLPQCVLCGHSKSELARHLKSAERVLF